MTFSNAGGDGILQLLFQNANFANVGDATGVRGATTAGSLYISLHSSDPGVGGSQTTNEVTTGNYDTYARVAVARASGAGGWTFTAASTPAASKIENTSAITWSAKGNSGTATVAWAGIGSASSGTGILLFRCPLALETPKPFVTEAADFTSNDITCPNHGFVANDQVVLIDVEGSILPNPATDGTVYFVMSSPTTDTFRISTATGDSGPVDLATTAGSGMVCKVLTKTVTQNDVFEIAAGKLVVYLK